MIPLQNAFFIFLHVIEYKINGKRVKKRMSDINVTTGSENVYAEDTVSGKYLTFRVADGEYGITIAAVIDIIKLQEITPVPHMPDYVRGITNLRGTIAPVIDMRLRFGHQEMAYDERTCIIVLSMNDMNIGLIVEEVREVADIGTDSIQPPPKSTGEAVRNNFVESIGTFDGRVRQLLDINRVFDIADYDSTVG